MQIVEAEGFAAQLAELEQIRFHAPRQAAGQRCADGFAFRFGPLRISPAAVQRRDDRRVDMLGHHQIAPQIERWRIDSAAQQLGRFREIGPIVGRRAAIGDVHGHAMAAAGAASALPVVRRQRRHVAHQHGVQLADVYAEFQGGRADEAVHAVRFRCPIRLALEPVLHPLAVRRGHHRGVLLRAQHGVGAVEQLQIVVVRVFPHPLQLAIAAIGRAAVVWQCPRSGAAAVAATAKPVVAP